MPDRYVLLEEIHLQFHVPRLLDLQTADSIRRKLNSRAFHYRLRRLSLASLKQRADERLLRVVVLV